jgi:N-acetylmuramoyl-L-alanine amidase
MTHQVRRGDTIVQIAKKYGFRSIAPIWDHPNNAALRAQRPNPFVLSQGDQVFIPEKEMEDYSCETNQRHVFRVKNMKQSLRQKLLDGGDRPLAGKKYELSVAGKQYNGVTDGSGELSVEIPLDAKTGELKLWLTDNDPASVREWTLQLGHLEPVETIFGLKGHLSNLGYDCGDVDDNLDDKAKDALREFQKEHDLPVTGENDQATRSKLRALFEYPIEAGA